MFLAILTELHDCPMHNTPSLSTRYIPGIRGSQQTIVSILMKRTVTEQINSSQFGSSPSEDSKESSPHQDYSSIRILSDESPCSLQNAEEGVSKSLEELHGPVGVDYNKPTKSTPNLEKKRKLKGNQPSQLSLKSFFQKVPKANNGKDAIQNPEDASKLSDNSKDTSRSDGFDKSDCCTSTPTMEQNLPAACCASEKDKKDSCWSGVGFSNSCRIVFPFATGIMSLVFRGW